MVNKTAFTIIRNSWCMLFIYFKSGKYILFLFLSLLPLICLSQEEPQFDEITVYLNVPGVGGTDIPALIKSEKVYLSITDVFTLLKIKNSPSSRLDSVSGFFINLQDEYLIDGVKKQIVFQKKKIEVKPDELILTETSLYLKSNLFGEVFGLNCQFNVRNLTVELTTKLELPTIREMKTLQMRDNLKRLRGEIKTDTTIGRRYPLLKFGMAEWNINTNQNQGYDPTTQLSLNLGSMVAGGEMNLGLNYNQPIPFDLKQQTYLWRYANNEHQALRQVLIGKLSTQTISSLNGPILGVQFNNTPTIYRKSFGTYTLTNVTEPGWLVELYINNVLIDYVKADASGFYKFEVPLSYGNSILRIRAYGPWGEVRERIENSNIPFNFLPPGELEYTSTAGVIEDQPNTKFSRTNINYGISRRMAIGGGYEYFSSPTVENSLPFVNSSLIIFKKLLLAFDYTLGVRLKSSLNYRLPASLQFDMNYTLYAKGQNAIPYSPLEETGVSISVPLQRKHFSLYSMLLLSQRIFDKRIYSNYQTTNATLLLSGNLNGISSNATTSFAYLNSRLNSLLTNISFSFRLPYKYILRPSAQFDFVQHNWTSMKWQLDKPLFKKGYLNISYNKDFKNKMYNSLDVGFRYDFSFMQTSMASKISKNTNSFSQSASGGLLFDPKTKYIGTSNTGTLGRAGFVFTAFLDMNGNGIRDKNEPKVNGLNIRVNGGTIVKNDKDSTVRVIDLVPYTSYLVEMNSNSFQNIAWKVKKTALSVYADPNQFKSIEIPVDVMSEASGTVTLKTKNGSRGLGRVYVNFYRSDETYFGRVLTESDGYYSFMGLKPGEYIARMDSSQLSTIRLAVIPNYKTFTVKKSREGDFVEGIDFILRSTAKDTTEIPLPKVDSSKIKIINYASNSVKEGVVVGANKPELRMESTIPGVRYSQALPALGKTGGKDNTVKPGDLKAVNLKGKPSATLIKATDQNAQISEADGQRCSIQYGEYTLEKDALSDQRTITKTTGRPVIIVKEGEVYKLWIEGFNNRREARAFLASLGKVEMPTNVDREVVAMNKAGVVSNTDEMRIPVPEKESKIGEIVNPVGKNQLIDYTDSIANIFKFEPKGSKTRGFPVTVKQADISNVVTKTDVRSLPVNNKPTVSNPVTGNQRNQNAVSNEPQFSIRVDGFIFDKSATGALRRISTETKLPIIISIKDGFYNLLIQGFASRRDAKVFEEKLGLMGFKGTIVRGI